MKIYKILSYNSNVVINHGYFDYVEAQAKLREIALQDSIGKIEIYVEHVKTYTKKSNDNS